ncbi:MAG: hypothetical protein AB7C96_11250 [Hydrogenovibrio sp.]
MNLKINAKLLASLLFIFFLPSFFFVVLNFSSLAIGLIVILFFLLPFYLDNFFSERLVLLFVIAFMLVLFSSVYAYFYTGNLKAVISAFVIFIILLFLLLISEELGRLAFGEIYNTVFGVYLVLLLFGLLSLVYTIPIPLYLDRPKAVFPFSEESHYGLALGMLSITLVSVSHLKHSLFILISLIFFALIFPSLTLLVFGMIAFFIVSLRVRFGVLLFLALVLVALVGMFQIPYFYERLDFSEENRNLTFLVFAQGVMIIYESLTNLNFFGHGFQSLGLNGLGSNVFTEQIIAVTGKPMNLQDGGFLFAKIFFEFGVLAGIVLLTFYCYVVIKILLKINLYCGFFGQMDATLKKEIFFQSFLIGLAVELFLRGYGYFSPTLLIASLFYLNSKSLRHV